jgi:hypothetical protein
MPFGPYPDATCPTGTTLAIEEAGRDLREVCQGASGLVAATCPAGSTPYYAATEARETSAVCVPSTTALYEATMSGGDFPCRAGDAFASADGGSTWKCLPSGSAAPAAPSGGGSLDTLSSRLSALRTQYTTLATQATATPAQMSTLLPQIQSVNQQIASVLDEMVTQLQYARAGANSDAYRTQLVEQLARIQMDYNGLKTNTDALQTLQRIRSFQDTSWRSTLFMYLAGFLGAAILLVLVMLFRRQKNVSASAPAMSPTAIPPLT